MQWRWECTALCSECGYRVRHRQMPTKQQTQLKTITTNTHTSIQRDGSRGMLRTRSLTLVHAPGVLLLSSGVRCLSSSAPHHAPPPPPPAQSSRARRVLPTAVVLRQMAGLPADHTPSSTETPDERFRRLKREENVSKAAAIEASRLARQRLETIEILPDGMTPNQPSKKIPILKQRYTTQTVSPFKKFDPFFDYSTALDEAQQPQQQGDEEEDPITAKTKNNKNNNKKKQKSSITSAGTDSSTKSPSSSSSPPPPPPPPRVDPHKLAMSVRSASFAKESESIPYARLPSKTLRPSKILAERAQMLARSKDTPQSVELDAVEAAKRALETGEDVPIDEPTEINEDKDEDDKQKSTDPVRPIVVRKRGPTSPQDLIRSNKHAVNSSHLESKNSKKRAKRAAKAASKSGPSSSSSKKGKSTKVEPGPDGKMPLQSDEGGRHTITRPKVVPWHPQLYIKQFLMKIHPDLYHIRDDPHEIGEDVAIGDGGPTQEKLQRTKGETMVTVNQETVAKFNAIVDYYKHVKALPPTILRIPDLPILPSHPQSISFYCRVPIDSTEVKLDDLTKPSSSSSSSSSPNVNNQATRIKLFEGTFDLSSFDLSSLPRLIGSLEEFFMRLSLSSHVDLSQEVRQRWQVIIRQRMIEKDLWRRGELEIDQNGQNGYLVHDPTPNSFSQSPGRYQKEYMRFYAQTTKSHEAIQHGRGYKSDGFMHNPFDASSKKFPPLLENMLRSRLLTFEEDLDMVQRIQTLQTMMEFMEGYNLRYLYSHLWIGVKITIRQHRYEYDEDDHNYRFSADEWELPYDFKREKLVNLIRQYLQAYHGDNPQGLTLLDKI